MNIRRSMSASGLVSGTVLAATWIAATRLLSIAPAGSIKATGTTATGTTDTGTTDQGTGLSVVLEGLHEPQISTEQNIDIGDPQIGQIGNYYDELYDPDRERLGVVFGRFEVRYKKVGGAVLTYYTEDIYLRDGIIHAEGWADFNDVKNGRWVGYPAVGIDGAYRGLDGRREWRVIEPHQPVEARIILAG
ncbi:hypothetical protein ND748_20045 [Frankia sp. AiPs1]|uniref:allene oxide cyclase barrel-like domain-containing protein n=1 Tax=Frankia sp. AiPs1 TaxID=573493 RepID=UPI002043474B|nr:hypothetical protein [Frankia sp. AiPs1]MCM3923951.1 hypothetical protein [Frankia sp. AiPs1]